MAGDPCPSRRLIVKREFATAWRRWLAKTGKGEETHRPIYGRPVDD
jgi:hypothetical protein